MYKQCFEVLTAQGKSILSSLSLTHSAIYTESEHKHRSLLDYNCNAVGPKPHKSFSVSSGPTEVKKEYEQEIKSNLFSLNGQRI